MDDDAWITSSDVEVILRRSLAGDEWIDGLIWHAQFLAEIEIGEQDAPTNRVKAVLAQIVARLWQDGESARVNPAGLAMEVAGPFTIQDASPGTAGLGLTNREKAAIKRAAGLTTIGTISTTRGDLETADVGGPHEHYPADDPFRNLA